MSKVKAQRINDYQSHSWVFLQPLFQRVDESYHLNLCGYTRDMYTLQKLFRIHCGVSMVEEVCSPPGSRANA